MAGISNNNWARVWARAARNPVFNGKLETDPLMAYRRFREVFPSFPASTVLIDGLESYEGDVGVHFSTMTIPQLDAIIAGTSVVTILPNELKKLP